MLVQVTNQKLEVIEQDFLVSGTVNEYTVRFDFDESWVDYDKIAVFKQDRTGLSIDVALTEHIEEPVEPDTEGTVYYDCTIPWDVLSNNNGIFIGVYGISDGKRKPSIWTNRIPVHLGTEIGSNQGSYVRSLYEELINAIANDTELSKIYSKAAIDAADRAESYLNHGPIINEDGNWCLYDMELQEYVDTEVSAKCNADWDENDQSAREYVKNRTHYTDSDGSVKQLNEKYIPNTIARTNQIPKVINYKAGYGIRIASDGTISIDPSIVVTRNIDK